MAMPARDLESDYEDQRRSAAIDDLLKQIGLSDDYTAEWWNRSFAELKDRTPTQAWLAGDQSAVHHLVAQWYADSIATGKRLRSDPAFTDRLRSRAEKLRGADR